MYLQFYNLHTMPFQLTPDSQFFFESREHKRAIAHLLYGLSQQEGFVVITGEIGAGKTMLIEHLWSQLDAQNFLAVRISTTQVSGDDLLRMIADGFGVVAAAGVDKSTLLRKLQEFFENVQAIGKRCLLVIDEIQNLPIVALEELRMLSNVTIESRAPFQCLLLGQPQFRQVLTDPRLEQVQQRVLASCHLGPLNNTDTREYVLHRLRTAGWVRDPSFEEAAFSAIYRHSEGIPRKINILCSRVLLAGYLDDTHDVTELMIDEVAGELHRDLAAGSEGPVKQTTETVDVDERLRAIEKTVDRHNRAIKRALEITARLIEART